MMNNTDIHCGQNLTSEAAMSNYRIVVKHDKSHDDEIVIQKRFLLFFWHDVRCIIRLNGMTFEDALNEAHTELLNFIEYG